MSKVFHEPRHAGEFILSEANGNRSREAVTVAPKQNIEPGTLLALLVQPSAVTTSVVPGSKNTGNGAVTMAKPAVSAKVKHGTYRATATSGTAFTVENPNGMTIGKATVGAAFNKEVKFTIAAGSSAFVAGDTFTILIDIDASRGYEAVAFDADSTDGHEWPRAIAIYSAVTGESETIKIAALVRDAEVNTNCLAWPNNINPKKKAAAIAELARNGIIVR